jgi:two-component system, NtrC family, sensor histidine kinase HupT/HoxJ
MRPDQGGGAGGLIDRLAEQIPPAFGGDQEAAWIEVIRRMDEVYADLLRYETDLEDKNAALEEAQAFISSVIESVSDILIVCDRNGVILQANPAAVRLLGVPADKLIGRSLAELIDLADRPHVIDLLKTQRSTDVIDLELRFITEGGPSDLYAINGATRADPAGQRAGAVLTGRPVGELRRAYQALHVAHGELQSAQRQLVEQEKMASLGRLVAGVAHELNNPISFIYGNIHTLERYRRRMSSYLQAIHNGAEPAEIERLRQDLKIDALLSDYASLIEGTLEGATRVSEVVRNLRRVSFPKSGQTERIDVDRVSRTAARLAARAKPGCVDIAFDIAADIAVVGNEGQFHQIIVNLVDNAIDAVRGRAASRIEIAASRRGDDVVITVADNGPGFAADLVDRIFEPFFTTKPVGEGTGLGLWISYGIAREQGGSLVAENRDSGGATFSLTLPAAR